MRPSREAADPSAAGWPARCRSRRTAGHPPGSPSRGAVHGDASTRPRTRTRRIPSFCVGATPPLPGAAMIVGSKLRSPVRARAARFLLCACQRQESRLEVPASCSEVWISGCQSLFQSCYRSLKQQHALAGPSDSAQQLAEIVAGESAVGTLRAKEFLLDLQRSAVAPRASTGRPRAASTAVRLWRFAATSAPRILDDVAPQSEIAGGWREAPEAALREASSRASPRSSGGHYIRCDARSRRASHLRRSSTASKTPAFPT